MSHELRTPMHSILSFARLGLRKSGAAPREKLKTYFELIVSSGDQLLELLDNLLDLGTLESAHASYSLREYDLAEDVKKVVSEFRAIMDEKEITLIYHSFGSPAPARYDRTRLFQVLRNLLANAMKYTAPGREVRVVLESGYLQKNGYRQRAWKVMVVDQGIGVSKEELVSVFEKFVRGSKTKEGDGGVGLGLSICKRIIDDHHGAIWVEQNEKEGTTFCFLLPSLE
jgi:two-component system sensor kinase FixL